MTVIRSRSVTLDGFRTHYSESGGDGPVVVALHGGGSGSSGEAGMAPLMRALRSDIRVVAPDSVGGFGKTDPHAPAPYGLKSRVDHLERIVDVLGLDEFVLLGNSQGAWVAAKYAALHPGRVQHLAMVGTATVALAMGIPQEETPAMKALRGYDGSREGMRRLLEALVHDRSRVTEALIDLRYASASRPGAPEAFRAAGETTRHYQADPVLKLDFDLTRVLPALTERLPVSFIWGEDDAYAVPALGRALEQMLPKARFHWIPNASHQVQTDQPERTAAVVASLLPVAA